MTYVPPEKKQRGGTSGFGDTIYVILFYLIEGFFIFLGIPALILAVAIIPISMYVVIRGEQGVTWPLYVIGVFIVFCQVFGVQFFVRKYILKPHNMTFGQWLRWKFSPTEIKKRRQEKIARSQKMEEWYDNMDKIHESKERLKEEQSYQIRDEWFGEAGDPDGKVGTPSTGITFSDSDSIEFGEISEKASED